jgi:hypothetical protein
MIPLAALALGRAWWKAGVGVVIGAALALPVGQCQGANAEKARQKTRDAEAALQAEIRNAAAKEAAAAQRAVDLARVTAAEKGRTDAIRAGADEAPSGPELRLACERLRAQGTAAARLPAVCRPGGSGQAPVDR